MLLSVKGNTFSWGVIECLEECRSNEHGRDQLKRPEVGVCSWEIQEDGF